MAQQPAYHKSSAQERYLLVADLQKINDDLYAEQLVMCRKLLEWSKWLPATMQPEVERFLRRFESGREVMQHGR